MRLSFLVRIAAVASIGLWTAHLCSAEAPSTGAAEKAPKLIVFSMGTWHFVDTFKVKDGSVIYTKPGGSARATPEYKVDWRRTTEVNQALYELLDFCLTDRADRGRIEFPQGRSGEIFIEASSRVMPKCLAEARASRNRDQVVAQEEQAKQEALAGLTDSETSKTLQQADKVVLTNRSVSTTARRADGYGPALPKRSGPTVEFADLAPEVIAEECQKVSAVGTPRYTACHDQQTAALERIEKRTPGSVPVPAYLNLRGHCRNEWVRDYFKRDSCETAEIRAYHAVQRLGTDPRYDPVFLNRVRVDCERASPISYTLQEGCLKKVLAGAPVKN